MAKTALVDNTPLDLLNYPTQPHSLIANYLTLFILTICENKHVIINVWGYPGGYSKFQVTGMIEWGQKSKPKQISWASNKTQKIP